MGYDLEGNKLTQGRGLFRQPKEALITLPAELSQSLKDHPEIARDILRAVVAAHLAEVEREAVRVRVGGGLREWHEARTLTLAVPPCGEPRGGGPLPRPHDDLCPGEGGGWVAVMGQRAERGPDVQGGGQPGEGHGRDAGGSQAERPGGGVAPGCGRESSGPDPGGDGQGTGRPCHRGREFGSGSTGGDFGGPGTEERTWRHRAPDAAGDGDRPKGIREAGRPGSGP